MQLFSADPTIVFEIFKNVCFDHQKLKNHPQKLLRIPQIQFFFFTTLTAKAARPEEFMF